MAITCESVDHAFFSNIMEDNGTLVTTGKRLANYFRQQSETEALAAYKSAAHKSVWVTPDVLPWSGWIQRLWEEACISGSIEVAGQVLSDAQQAFLWEQIVANSTEGESLLQVSGAARDAMKAWATMQSWAIALDDKGFLYNDDSRVFRSWARKFQRECRQQGWVPVESLPDLLSESIESGNLSVSNRIFITGFDEYTPQQQRFIEALKNTGTDVRWVEIEEDSETVVRIACKDALDEAKLVARWTRQRLEVRPGSKIGIVVPDLASERSRMLGSLDEILSPGAWSPQATRSCTVSNVSLGLPLKDYPVIRTALYLLYFISDPLPLNDLGVFLRSPAITGWDDEHGARALLDGRLRENGELAVELSTVRSFANQDEKNYACPVLVGLLDNMVKHRGIFAKKKTPGEWAEHFTTWLKVAGWVQGRTLSSEEYQVVEVWKEVITAFGSLDIVQDVLTKKEAIRLLDRLTMERIFQPETEDAPVQVIGMLEASGLCFDHVWIMGLHENAWPPSPRPTPFIPLPIQRAQDVPGSSAERELRIASLVMRRLFRSGKEVVVSYPEFRGEEKLNCSPLLLEIPEIDRSDLNVWIGNTWREQIFQSRVLEELGEDPAPPVVAKDFRGGSSVFKLQAACPFHAFAEVRLGARPLEVTSIGLQPTTRGKLAHRVLELVWGQLDSLDVLNSLDDKQLHYQVGQCVGLVLSKEAKKHPYTFTARFRVLEENRLTQLVLDWLKVEKGRAPFYVKGREEEFNVTVGGVNVRLIIDRIDELSDGSYLLVDYKTGKVSPGTWFGERPEEPQLPLYATVVGNNIGGVSFGSLRPGDIGFNGVTRESGVLPSVKGFDEWSYTKEKGGWSQVLNEWQQILQDLGADFCKGNAEVDPKKVTSTCQYCGLQSLCRIHEQSLLSEIKED
ncbi:MAG: PD-(D/E)XK nuclease family protein [Gammaproteobacteria bacterium]|nr:PD-(D/E)XK nuclease family protein [Gammaproteobacteria bacterium]